ncbi:hypothetical protein ACOMCU_08395 [Lysinibacillus sp. UGB7]|uniref:hypothetical protein n=1 Tax=Lysinibacillus sp. UGB7 TaxID=3411039 RepID=UPI003B7A336A
MNNEELVTQYKPSDEMQEIAIALNDLYIIRNDKYLKQRHGLTICQNINKRMTNKKQAGFFTHLD